VIRLVIALGLGAVVGLIYCRTRKSTAASASLIVTLVLLTILIAIVTQVIGDNVARAFSLVGALSIVRFRTVVRDTQDTAYVIFAVVVGMAVGAKDLGVALIGIAVVGLAAYLMLARSTLFNPAQPVFLMNLRLGIGLDPEKTLGLVFDAHLRERELMSIATARQGICLDLIYQTRLRPTASVEDLVKSLNRIEGVQSVQLQQRDFAQN